MGFTPFCSAAGNGGTTLHIDCSEGLGVCLYEVDI